MTNKEAIERLNLMQERCCNGYDAEAINLAIKALEVVEKIKSEVKDWLEDEKWNDYEYINNISNIIKDT